MNCVEESAAVSEINTWLRTLAGRMDFRQMDARRCLAPHLVLELGNKGLLGMQVPVALGGLLGLSCFEQMRVQRQLGAIDLTLAFFVGLNNGLGIRPLVRFASPELQQRYLPQLATGRMLAAFAVTEPCAGSNPLGMRTEARREGPLLRVSGHKAWCGSAAWAGVITLIARHLDEQGRDRGFVALCLDAAQPGLHQGSEALTLGLKGMIQNRLQLDAAPVTPDRVLGSASSGLAVAAETMGFGRLGIAATCVGALWRCLQLMHDYAHWRHIGGRSLAAFGHARLVLAQAHGAASALGNWVDQLACAMDAGRPVPAVVLAAVKLLASETLGEVSDAALQLLGGRGFCDNSPIGQLWRDARVTRLFEGPSETLAAFIGQSVLDLRQPSDDTWLAGQAQAHRQTLECLRAEGPVDELQAQRLGVFTAWSMLAGSPQQAHARAWAEARLAQARQRLLSEVPHADVAQDLAGAIDASIGRWRNAVQAEDVVLDDWMTQVCP